MDLRGNDGRVGQAAGFFRRAEKKNPSVPVLSGVSVSPCSLTRGAGASGKATDQKEAAGDSFLSLLAPLAKKATDFALCVQAARGFFSSAASMLALSVRSQVNSGSLRPKCP